MDEDTKSYPAQSVPAVDRSITGIVPRGMVAGTLAGLIAGAVVGTLIAPVIGTVVGFVVGTVTGLLLGSIDSLVLVPLAGLLDTRPKAAAGTAVVAGVSGAVTTACVGLADAVEMTFVMICIFVGAATGPRVMLGRRPR